MKICLLPGDGIGVEIVDAAVEVLDAAAKKFGFEIEYDKQRSPAGSNYRQR